MVSQMRRPLRVLIVEDEAMVALDLSDQVVSLGHEVVGIAGSADAAMTLSAKRRPDVALVDVQLAGEGDGTDAATVMRERDDVRSLFLTAHTDVGTRDRAQASWPLGMISKPVRPSDLASALAGAACVIEWRW